MSVCLFVCLGVTNSFVFADKDDFEVIYCSGENENSYFNEKYLPNWENIFSQPVMCGICTGIFSTGLDRLAVVPKMLNALLTASFFSVIFLRYYQAWIQVASA